MLSLHPAKQIAFLEKLALELREEEKKYFASALRRRQLRLILAGKMKPDDATELKALFA